MTPQNKALVTRTRKLLAELASGNHDMNGRTDLLTRINANTLKLDRAGEPSIADELGAAKAPALAAGEKARSDRLAADARRARDEHREALRADPAAWMRR